MWCSPTFDLLPCLGQHSARSFLCLSVCLSVCLFLLLLLSAFPFSPSLCSPWQIVPACSALGHSFAWTRTVSVALISKSDQAHAHLPALIDRKIIFVFSIPPRILLLPSLPPSRPFTRSPTIPIRIDGKSGASRTNNKTQATKKKRSRSLVNSLFGKKKKRQNIRQAE